MPTYVYLVSIFGAARARPVPVRDRHDARLPRAGRLARRPRAREPLGLLLILRAFASGSVALTGIEAVSNGVPAFKPPEARNAQLVARADGRASSALIFLGMSFLAGQLGILPDPTEQETVRQPARPARSSAPGRRSICLVQISTALLLVLAANTSFADFPRLSSILARDGFLPRRLPVPRRPARVQQRIVVLAAVAVVLLVASAAASRR